MYIYTDNGFIFYICPICFTTVRILSWENSLVNIPTNKLGIFSRFINKFYDTKKDP